MDRVTVNQTLHFIWPALFVAQSRELTGDELAELDRLLCIVENAELSNSEVALAAAAFCLEVRSSGLFEKRPVPAGVLPRLRAKIDQLNAGLYGEI